MQGIHGIGDVVVEPLWDVWNHSQARINNSMDNAVAPFSSEEVVARALQVTHDDDGDGDDLKLSQARISKIKDNSVVSG